ncbi:uncharacterized protein LOC131639569 [Vicia villosa]|uniref:uncharacterized protein LOC131639569 n=1 Tax=Vicia villosa TaxID=3911 RepID=UPI00273BF947|nr:uncharacterized protein LOC131639569 [Vicia villosa]
MIIEEIKGDCQEADESDEESYVGDLTISELATGFTETCLMNEKLCAKVREYRTTNRFLLEERVSFMEDIADLERKLEDTRPNEQETRKMGAQKETKPTISGACEVVTTDVLTSKSVDELSVSDESKSSSNCNAVTSVGNTMKLQIIKNCVTTDLSFAFGTTKTIDENHSEKMKGICCVKFPPIPIFSQKTATDSIDLINTFLNLNCSDASHNSVTRSSLKNLEISQQPNTSSPKKVSPISESATPNESTNPNRVLNVSPLRMINAEDSTTTKPRTPHARRPEESVRTKGSNPSSSKPRKELTKEGTRYVHNSIAKIVKRILDENHQVPGISVPLQTVIPDPPKRKRNETDGHNAGSDIHMTGEKNNEEVQEDDDNTNITEDVNDIGNYEAYDSPRVEAGTVERLMTMRKDKVVIQNSPVKKAAVKSPPKDSVKKKSTSVGPVKSRTKSIGVGPSKSWSKVVPKKRKARAVEEFESDDEVNVHDIPLKKKPTTSKLAGSVPEVPIDNVSFHFAASANRWKFVYQKRLALERELALMHVTVRT